MKLTPRDLLVALAAAGATIALVAFAAESSSNTKPARMESTVLDWEKLVVQATKVGARRSLFDAPTTTLRNFEGHVTTLNPGEAPHAAHRHPDEEMIIVKEGTLEVTIDGKSQTAGPGSVFFYASNALHGMRNVGNVPATYFVFRWITPDTPKAPSP